MITSAQIRAARGFLNMSQVELSAESGISIGTIRRIESGEQFLEAAGTGTIKKIKTFLESRGIKFLSEVDAGDGAGLRYFQSLSNKK